MNLPRVILIVTVCVASANRVKRILYGDIITTFGNDVNTRQFASTYDAIYYTVAMKPAWGQVVQAMEWNDRDTSWEAQTKPSYYGQANWAEALKRPRNNRCGGSFLTPWIVQTACHCVAHFFRVGSLDKVVWEEPLVIYATLGFSKAGRAWGNGIYSSRRYYAHKLCSLWSLHLTRIINYDYALITLAKGDWGLNDPPGIFPDVNTMKTAPLYTAQDLNKHYMNIMRRQAVCLFLGHGYSTLGNSSGVMSVYRPGELDALRDNGLPRHTWRTITGYRFCYDFIHSVLNLTKTINDVADPNAVIGKKGPIVWIGPDVEMREPTVGVDETINQAHYAEEVTFTCSMNAGKFQAIPVAGDGGYPVTCNNIYFAIEGIGWTRRNPTDRMSIQSAIVYAKFENAADFRDDLLNKMGEWNRYLPPGKPKDLRFEGSSLQNISPNSGRKTLDFPSFLLLAVPFTSSLIKTSV